MMLKTVIIVSIFSLYALHSFSQFRQKKMGQLYLTSISGEVNINSSFRKQQQLFSSGIEGLSDHFFLLGGIKFNSDCFVWHPNFLKLNLGLEINTGTIRNNFIVIPDRSEVQTLSNINL